MPLEDVVRHLSRVKLLAELAPEALRLIAFSAETLTLARGDVLFSAGEVSDGGFVILRGMLMLETPGMSGRPLGPDTLIGETALLVATRRPATLRAIETATVLKIPAKLFVRVLEAFPEAARRLRAQSEARLSGFAAELDAMRRRSLAD